MSTNNDTLKAQLKRLSEALEFYANDDNWEDTGTPWDDYISKARSDAGDIARKALGLK